MSAQVAFVSPPGWPAPAAGWLPPADWRVPADWPSVPAGWIFYRGPYGEPVAAPPGHWDPTGALVPVVPASTPADAQPSPAMPPIANRKSRTPLLVGVGVAVLALIVGAVFAVPRLMGSLKGNLTRTQYELLLAKPTLGGLPARWDVVTDAVSLEPAQAQIPDCVKFYTFGFAHQIVIKRSLEATHLAIVLMDTAESMATYYDLNQACTVASGMNPAPKETGTVRNAVWRSWDAAGNGTGRLMVYYRNVYVIVSLSEGQAFDRQAFTNGVISDVDSVG